MPLRQQTYLHDLDPIQFDMEFQARIDAAKIVDEAIIDQTSGVLRVGKPRSNSFALRLSYISILIAIKWHILNPDNRVIHPAGESTLNEGDN